MPPCTPFDVHASGATHVHNEDRVEERGAKQTNIGRPAEISRPSVSDMRGRIGGTACDVRLQRCRESMCGPFVTISARVGAYLGSGVDPGSTSGRGPPAARLPQGMPFYSVSTRHREAAALAPDPTWGRDDASAAPGMQFLTNRQARAQERKESEAVRREREARSARGPRPARRRRVSAARSRAFPRLQLQPQRDADSASSRPRLYPNCVA